MQIIFPALFALALVLGCEQNANVRVATTSEPVLLSTPPETSLTSVGTLNTSTQDMREAILAVARDLNLGVLQSPPAGIEGEAVLSPPTGAAIRVYYKEVSPRRIDLNVRRDNAPSGQEVDSLTRRIFTEVRARSLSGDPTGPAPK